MYLTKIIDTLLPLLVIFIIFISIPIATTLVISNTRSNLEQIIGGIQ